MMLWVLFAALVTLALAFPLRPLWRQESAPAGRRFDVAVVLVLVPAVTIGLYLALGAPSILEQQALVRAQAGRDADAMLSALERRLESEPGDAEGWHALGRAYIALQRIGDAELALSKASALAPKDAHILAQYAEALALRSGKLEGRPLELVMAALDLDYGEEKALELAGLAAFQREDWAQALHFWRRLQKRLPKESEYYEGIAEGVRIAEGKVAQASGLGDRARLVAPDKGN